MQQSHFSDPTGHVCYTSGPREGQCYEGADGEDWAMTAEEEKLTVEILTPEEGYDSNGHRTDPVNVRLRGTRLLYQLL